MPTIQRGDFSTYYEDTGSGEPLVLICGLGADLQIWRNLVPFLSKHFRVIALDNRGAGRSSAPDEPYTIPGMAADVIALLDHLQLAPVNLLGWSMGGVIAQSLAVAHPTRVKHLLLLATLKAPDAMLRNGIANWVNIRRSNMTIEQVVRYVAQLVFSPAFAENVPTYEATIQFMVNNPYRQSLHGFLRQAEALLAHTAPSELSGIPMPVSILASEQDQLTPRYLSEDLKATLLNATLHVLPGAHLGAAEHPERYANEIVALIHSPAQADA
jgi:3-oxoadipate enol-lactonase